MRYIAAIILLVVSSVSHAKSLCTELYYASAVADVYTTKMALDRGFTEKNPFLGSNPSDETLALSTGLRILSGYLVHKYSDERVNCVLSVLTFGVVGNNVGLLDGRGPGDPSSIIIGVMFPITIEAIYREVTK